MTDWRQARTPVRFLSRWAAFMAARDSDRAPVASGAAESIEQSTTCIDPEPWTSLVPWSLAQGGHPPTTGYRG
jgi:hypothetical protein